MKQFYLIVASILLIAAIFSAKYEYFSDVSQWKIVKWALRNKYYLMRVKNNKVECYNSPDSSMCMEFANPIDAEQFMAAPERVFETPCICSSFDNPASLCSDFAKQTGLKLADIGCGPAAPATVTAATPATVTAVQPPINVETLMKDIRSVVKEEIRANNMNVNTQKRSDAKLAADTVSLLQGRQYTDPAKYDMNEYIRKDSIPCYACTLDY
jgi:hypothetical protein